MAIKGLYALQNGFMGFEKTGLFFGERSAERVQIPITCYVIRSDSAVILFDTGVSPRAVSGLMRTDALARFGEEDLLVHRIELLGLEPENIDLVVLSHLHFDHAGGADIFPSSELIVQKDEYAFAHYPSQFLASIDFCPYTAFQHLDLALGTGDTVNIGDFWPWREAHLSTPSIPNSFPNGVSLRHRLITKQ